MEYINIYKCANCRQISSDCRIHCKVCKDVYICLPCFSMGVEFHSHRRDHNYEYTDIVNGPLKDLYASTTQDQAQLQMANEQFFYEPFKSESAKAHRTFQNKFVKGTFDHHIAQPDKKYSMNHTSTYNEDLIHRVLLNVDREKADKSPHRSYFDSLTNSSKCLQPFLNSLEAKARSEIPLFGSKINSKVLSNHFKQISNAKYHLSTFTDSKIEQMPTFQSVATNYNASDNNLFKQEQNSSNGKYLQLPFAEKKCKELPIIEAKYSENSKDEMPTIQWDAAEQHATMSINPYNNLSYPSYQKIPFVDEENEQLQYGSEKYENIPIVEEEEIIPFSDDNYEKNFFGDDKDEPVQVAEAIYSGNSNRKMPTIQSAASITPYTDKNYESFLFGDVSDETSKTKNVEKKYVNIPSVEDYEVIPFVDKNYEKFLFGDVSDEDETLTISEPKYDYFPFEDEKSQQIAFNEAVYSGIDSEMTAIESDKQNAPFSVDPCKTKDVEKKYVDIPSVKDYEIIPFLDENYEKNFFGDEEKQLSFDSKTSAKTYSPEGNTKMNSSTKPKLIKLHAEKDHQHYNNGRISSSSKYKQLRNLNTNGSRKALEILKPFSKSAILKSKLPTKKYEIPKIGPIFCDAFSYDKNYTDTFQMWPCFDKKLFVDTPTEKKISKMPSPKTKEDQKRNPHN